MYLGLLLVLDSERMDHLHEKCWLENFQLSSRVRVNAPDEYAYKYDHCYNQSIVNHIHTCVGIESRIL